MPVYLHYTKHFIEVHSQVLQGEPASLPSQSNLNFLVDKSLQEFGMRDIQQRTEVTLVRKEYQKAGTVSLNKSLFLLRRKAVHATI